jgi:hypothetical protein
VSRPDIVPELDRWYCYEYMVEANTPGARDGRITFWLDGVLAGDFPNLRLRDVDSLKIDRFGLSFHIGSNPAGETKIVVRQRGGGHRLHRSDGRAMTGRPRAPAPSWPDAAGHRPALGWHKSE